MTRSLAQFGWRLLSLGALAVLVVIGCGELSNKGSAPVNNPPQVFFTNIPVDGTVFSNNPTLFWYGTDDDGTIEVYQYSVILSTDVHDFVTANGGGLDTAGEFFINMAPEGMYNWQNIIVDSVPSATRSQVRLFSSFDTAFTITAQGDTIPNCDQDIVTQTQILPDSTENVSILYIIDSNGDTISVDTLIEMVPDDTVIVSADTFYVDCVSMEIPQYMFIRAIDDNGAVSAIRYRRYGRDNHWPNTRIQGFNQGVPYISLDSLTATYQGITIAWEGADSLDYPRSQPQFEYFWRVFGPFNSPEAADTSAAKLITTSRDTVAPFSQWVTDQSATLYNLWRHEPPSNTTRSAYFLFDVKTRDDAFAPDPTPSTAVFRVIDPKFENQILLIDDTIYSELRWLAPWPRSRHQAFLKKVMAEAAGSRWSEQHFFERRNGNLPIDLVSKYKLVVLVDDDKDVNLNFQEEGVLREYLGSGGNLWVLGRNVFLKGNQIDGSPRSIISTPPGTFAYDAFDVEGIFFPNSQELWAVEITDPDRVSQATEEFIAAKSLIPGLPDLEVDTSSGKYIDTVITSRDTTVRVDTTVFVIDSLDIDSVTVVSNDTVAINANLKVDTLNVDLPTCAIPGISECDTLLFVDSMLASYKDSLNSVNSIGGVLIETHTFFYDTTRYLETDIECSGPICAVGTVPVLDSFYRWGYKVERRFRLRVDTTKYGHFVDFIMKKIKVFDTTITPASNLDSYFVPRNTFIGNAYEYLYDYRFKGVPEVNFVVRGIRSRSLYTFVSYKQERTYLDDKVVATRFIGPNRTTPVFKTAVFCFSPFAMKEDELVPMMSTMFDWFLSGSFQL